MRRAIAAAVLAAAAPWASARAACVPDPLQGRALYLRGTFNAWTAPEAQRLRWACDRWSLVTRLPTGEHAFKLGDEGWSADADFGAASPDAARARLKRDGGVREFQRRLAAGTYRITLTMDHDLRIETCPADDPPLGATALFLRGTMNNWAALEDYQFQFSCDAYYLNVELDGRHEFKIADARWSERHSFGAGQGAYLAVGGGNVTLPFRGAHTLRLAWAGGRPELTLGPRSFADPRQQAVADPVARSLAFDSRSAEHKRPFGAVPEGTELRYALDALPGVERITLVIESRRLEGNQEVLEYAEVARVPMQRTDGERDARAGRQRWTAGHRFAAPGVYGYWFEAEIAGQRYALQNNGTPVYWTREKGAGGRGEVAERPADAALGTVRRFRQTVYRRDFNVPGWAADAVYYYVFPERFRNGDKGNDPRPGVTRYHDGTVERHPKWIDKPWKPGDGVSDDRYNNDFFGGDLQGLIDKLDDIADLGANVIYMTPVFQAASNHKYDTADYHRIDPGFGSNADFERLTAEAGKRGIRVMLDASLNHVGQDSRYFDRFGNYGGRGAFAGGRINAASPWFDWFSFDATQRDPKRQYKGWVGVADLPELNKASEPWRRFAYRDRDSVMKRWLDAGAGGWRMDVAPWVPDDFWREWRAEIKRHRPDAVLVAETWFDAAKYFVGDMFDSTMNYIFRNAVLDWARGGDARTMVANLELMREHYPPPAFHALMNLLSTHDQARSLHVLGWHDDGNVQQEKLAKTRYRLALLMQMAYPGAPAIYYGDEVGLSGGDDPDNRRPYPWADEGGQPDLALRAEFKRLIALRKAHPVLVRGSLGAPLLVDEHVVALPRERDGVHVITAFNNAATPRRVTVPLPPDWPRDAAWSDLLGGAASVAATAGMLTVDVPARGAWWGVARP